MTITVLTPGPLTSVQDLGRRGHAGFGIGSSGAMDGVALRLANLLVGNAENMPALEITLRGPHLRFGTDALIAITGAEIDARCNGDDVPAWRPVLMRGGAELNLGKIRRGTRAYLGIAGGIAATQLLGSCSADINAGIGPRALTAGDKLAIERKRTLALCGNWQSRSASAQAVATNWSLDPAPWLDAGPERAIGVIVGTHFSCLNADSQERLFDSAFRISADSNRVGYRLEGPHLGLTEPIELVSAGVVPGTLQLPPDGAPIVLMAEAPTTGGYPRIGHVATVDLPHLGQCRPGDSVRFTRISLATAQTRYLERERTLAALARTIHQRLNA